MGISPLDSRDLSELLGLSGVTFLVSGAPTTLLQYFDLMSNSNLVILAPALAGPVIVTAAYVYAQVDTASVAGYGLRLWFLLSMVNVGLMSVSYVALVALFGLS